MFATNQNERKKNGTENYNGYDTANPVKSNKFFVKPVRICIYGSARAKEFLDKSVKWIWMDSHRQHIND